VREEALAILREEGHIPAAAIVRARGERSIGRGRRARSIEFLLKDPDVTDVTRTG
jgi:hypothetical protein